MKTIQHSEACTKRAEAARLWRERWPNACQKCGGTGQYYEPGTYWEPPDSGPCGFCTEVGKCARCGAFETFDPVTGDGPCSACGFNFDDGEPNDECECDEPDYGEEQEQAWVLYWEMRDEEIR